MNKITREEAIAIIENLKRCLKNAEKIAGMEIHKDTYTTLDMAIEAMKEKCNGD